MLLEAVKKGFRRRVKPEPEETWNSGCDAKCRDRLSKKLKYDTAVPGDRGDCQQKSLTQGSE
jgi:hypothetical protein